MRIAITNDMLLAVEALRRVLVASGEHEVAWVARDGAEAVECCRRDRPDLILMDLVMPEVDGVEATRRIMAEAPCAILIVTSSVSRMAPKVFEALGAGALDAIKTPVLGPDLDGRKLLAKIRQVRSLVERRDGLCAAKPDPPDCGTGHPLVIVGASSGGPAALCKVLEGLPNELLASYILAQHIDHEFMPGLLAWLTARIGRQVEQTVPGQRPRPGQLLMASSSGKHVCLRPDGFLGEVEEPSDCPYRPSIDVLMESVARNWRGPAAGVVLTGMGADGAAGLLALRQAGHYTLAQDRETSAIYGMPKAAAELGGARSVLPLLEIAPALQAWQAKLARATRRPQDALN